MQQHELDFALEREGGSHCASRRRSVQDSLELASAMLSIANTKVAALDEDRAPVILVALPRAVEAVQLAVSIWRLQLGEESLAVAEARHVMARVGMQLQCPVPRQLGICGQGSADHDGGVMYIHANPFSQCAPLCTALGCTMKTQSRSRRLASIQSRWQRFMRISWALGIQAHWHIRCYIA